MTGAGTVRQGPSGVHRIRGWRLEPCTKDILRMLRLLLRESRSYNTQLPSKGLVFRAAVGDLSLWDTTLTSGRRNQVGWTTTITRETQHAASMSNEKSGTKKATRSAGASDSNDKKNATSCIHHWEDSAYSKKGQEEYRKFKEEQNKSDGTSDETQTDDGSAQSDESEAPKKRGLGANQNGSNKKQKQGGGSDQPKGIAGDKTRVPTQGQQVQWHSLPGWVDGKVVEVVYEHKTVEGKSVKGSKEDPRIVLKSASSGKIAVHKPEAVYFD